MSAKIQTLPGHGVPGYGMATAPRHSVTVHLPTWDMLQKFVDNPAALMPTFKSMYPRIMQHECVRNLTAAVLQYTGAEDQGCLLFPSMQSAVECRDFALAPKHVGPDDARFGSDPKALGAEQVTIRVFHVQQLLYAVFFPAEATPSMMPFWMHAGVGISSRLAEDNLKHIDAIREITAVPEDSQRNGFDGPSHTELRTRIASLMERSPVNQRRSAKVSANDVYLFQTGMAGIYKVHRYLLNEGGAKTVLFGMAFHSTPHVFEDYGPGCKLFGFGTEQEIDDLEDFLRSESEEGRRIQAVWAEFPTNPLLVTPNLGRLRKLADQYHFMLGIDDTLGSFCNVDVLDYADVVTTSLTKSFSGYADVIVGSAVLNPNSPMYDRLKDMFSRYYTGEFYTADADVLEHNSRDYLARSAILNNNAAALASYFQRVSQETDSPVKAVYYPTFSPSLPNYQTCMRPITPDFQPGYGCLFSVEFTNKSVTKAFYDNLNCHNGPHLGMHVTLALPYVAGIYGKQLDWAAQYDLRSTQIRFSAGLEETSVLLEDMEIAIHAAMEAKSQQSTNNTNGVV